MRVWRGYGKPALDRYGLGWELLSRVGERKTIWQNKVGAIYYGLVEGGSRAGVVA